jgi:sugar phosphate permease
MNIFKSPCDEAVMSVGKLDSPCAKKLGPWILAATILGSSMSFIDGTVVNVALPALQANLNATATDVQWVVEAYALFLAALLLFGGSLGDRFGRRLIYSIGVSVFALASLWCGLASNIHQLIIARAIQGVGGALLVPGSDWDMVWCNRHHCCAWTSARWLPDRTCLLACRLLFESSNRGRSAVTGLSLCAGKS